MVNLEYGNRIMNDKVYPGGAAIMDRYINDNMKELERLYRTDQKQYDIFRQKIADSLFKELRRSNKMDSILNFIFKEHHIKDNIEYFLVVESIELAFEHNKYVPFYSNEIFSPLIDSAIQTKHGIAIGGNLKDIIEPNLITGLSVSSANDYSYRLKFNLYGQASNRMLKIFQLMLPTFLLALFSMLTVVTLFYITFRNWLRQKNLSEMKSDFINSITHEFHTPLAAIIVANKTMQNEKIIISKESLLPLTEVIQRQSARLKMLISQVLDITTMNQVMLDKKNYSLHNLLDEILLDYRLKLAGTNILLTLRKEAVRDDVELDHFWFTTVLLNIFDNAIKYNNKDFKEITVTTINDKKNLLISIADNGIGMKEEVHKHIFEKFYRDPANLNGESKGLGLGLFYVKRAIDAHSWKIDIESRPGEGSVFLISMNYK
jgi:two-component system phosphate regulon sensor histidine kinase PhoR